MIIAIQKLPRKWGGWNLFKDGGDIKKGGVDSRMGGLKVVPNYVESPRRTTFACLRIMLVACLR